MSLYSEMQFLTRDLLRFDFWNSTNLFSDDGSIGCCVTRGSTIEVGFKSARSKKVTPIIKRSPSLPVNRSYAATRQKENLPKRNQGNVTMLVAAASSVDNKGPQFPPLKQSLDGRSSKRVESEEKANSGGPDIIKHTISEKSREDKVHGFGGLRSGSRVAPCSDDGDSVAKNGKDDVDESRKDSEELSLIREQLALIENQQSSLLDLLQVYKLVFDYLIAI